MGQVPAERWFHTLIVLGAALAGCGGNADDDGSAVESNSAGSSSANAGHGGSGMGGGPRSTHDCAAAAQFVCEDYATRAGCRCDPRAPLDKSACNSPFDFVCDEGPCDQSSADASVLCFPPAVGCRCDPQAPRPSDCATPEQFFCNELGDRYRDCACHPERAADPASCPAQVCCQSSNPRFGCTCDCVLIR